MGSSLGVQPKEIRILRHEYAPAFGGECQLGDIIFPQQVLLYRSSDIDIPPPEACRYSSRNVFIQMEPHRHFQAGFSRRSSRSLESICDE